MVIGPTEYAFSILALSSGDIVIASPCLNGACPPFVNPDLAGFRACVVRCVRIPCVFMAMIQSAEKLLPNGLRRRIAPLAARLAVILASDRPRDLAQRMALLAFAIRVVSAA